MPSPKMIGTVNGFSVCRAMIGKKGFTFDGTILGLTKSSLANGAKEGSKVKANFGLSVRVYTIKSAPNDNRAGGFWAIENFANKKNNS